MFRPSHRSLPLLLHPHLADCGPRIFCIDCPSSCQLRNTNTPRTAANPGCLNTMYRNGVCDPECNVYECAFDGGDCGLLQRAESCITLQRATSGVNTITRPPVAASGDSFDVALDFKLRPLLTYTEKNSGLIVYELLLSYTLQYSDPRLTKSKCASELQVRPPYYQHCPLATTLTTPSHPSTPDNTPHHPTQYSAPTCTTPLLHIPHQAIPPHHHTIRPHTILQATAGLLLRRLRPP